MSIGGKSEGDVPMRPQELRVIIRPDGRLVVEWTATDDAYNEQSLHFQQELYRRYHAKPNAWLLLLSFADPDIDLPPALAFWRDIAVCFAERLAHLPDLEAVRDKATVTVEDDDVRQWLAVAPLCPGAEYFSRDLLLQGFCRKVWFLRQNPKTWYHKFNDLQASKFPKKQICDRTTRNLYPLASERLPAVLALEIASWTATNSGRAASAYPVWPKYPNVLLSHRFASPTMGASP
jgi:hypothetical protein